MSDRIAVFNDGRIEQVGTAARDLRAAGDRRSSPASSARPTCSTASRPRPRRPATARSASARRSSASPGRRPAGRRPGDARADGHGAPRSSTPAPATRYVVDLDAGGRADRRCSRTWTTSLTDGCVDLAVSPVAPSAGAASTVVRLPAPRRTRPTDRTVRAMTTSTRALHRRGRGARRLRRRGGRRPARPPAAAAATAGPSRRPRSRPADARQARRRARARSTSSPGRATPRTAAPTRRSTGSRRSRSRPAARSTSRPSAPPTRWCSLMRTGEYDVVSASGDATPAADRRRATSSRSTPTWCRTTPTSSPFLKNQPWNSVDGADVRHPARLGRQPADVQHRHGQAGARLVGRRVRPELAVQGQGHRVRLADLHRRRRAVPDDDQARARHQEPVRPRPEAVRRRRRPAQAAER